MKRYDIEWICPACGNKYSQLIETNHPLKVSCICSFKGYLYQTINPKWTKAKNIKKRIIEQYNNYKLELEKYKEANDEEMILYFTNKMKIIEHAHPEWV